MEPNLRKSILYKTFNLERVEEEKRGITFFKNIHFTKSWLDFRKRSERLEREDLTPSSEKIIWSQLRRRELANTSYRSRSKSIQERDARSWEETV